MQKKCQSLIQEVLLRQVNQRRTVGVAAGLMEGLNPSFFNAGVARIGGEGPDADTVFCVGSVSKIFTALLLADMAARGEVALDDPVGIFLPIQVVRSGKIEHTATLMQLAMHHSGLPSYPPNFETLPFSNDDPHVHYTEDRMYAFLSSYEWLDGPRQYAYSNFGYALLGHALGRCLGIDFREAVAKRIMKPLEMNSTSATLTVAMKHRVAVGHDEHLRPQPVWNMNLFVPSGGMWSTTSDLCKFLYALQFQSPVEEAARIMRSYKSTTQQPDMRIALGWHLHGEDVYWHNGAVGGFRSFVGINVSSQRTVAILCNTRCDMDEIGMQLLH